MRTCFTVNHPVLHQVSHICFHNTTFFLADCSLALISSPFSPLRQLFPSSLFISLLPNPWGPALSSCISSSFTFNWSLTLPSQKGWARVEVFCVCPRGRMLEERLKLSKKYSEASGWKLHFPTPPQLRVQWSLKGFPPYPTPHNLDS